MPVGMVVVGAGECGVRAAFTLREAGWRGTVTLVGAEPELPYERPPLSKTVLAADSVPPPRVIADFDHLERAGIEFREGIAVADLDPATHELQLSDGTRLAYDRLLLATGAQPRRLQLPDSGTVRYLRTYRNAVALRNRLAAGAHLAVVGGGFLGMELAASASARGCKVTVVEMADRPLARLVPPEIAAIVAARHRRAGVHLRCGVTIVGLRVQMDGFLLELSTGESLSCDLVVAAIGALPDTELADKAGLDINNGVQVNALLATSDADIYAAGDCCSFPHPLYGHRSVRIEAWANARDQGAAAARNMLGDSTAYDAVPSFWSDQFELTLQIAGLPGEAVAEVVRRRPDGVDVHFGLDRDGRLVSASAIGTGNSAARDVRISELLIGQRAMPHLAMLADPDVRLRTLLAN